MSEETQVIEAQDGPVEEVQETTPEIPAWRKALEEAPVEELREHPRFKGVLGSELEGRRVAWKQENDARIQEEGQKLLEEQFTTAAQQLLEDDPEEFQRKFPVLDDYIKTRPARLAQQENATLRSSVREQFARQISAGFRAEPEWKELTPADHEDVLKALAGKDDDAVLAAFPAVMSAKLSEVKARKQIASYKDTELAKDREAIRLEERTALLQNGDRPGIGRARGNGVISDEPNWRTDPAAWNRDYERRNFGARR